MRKNGFHKLCLLGFLLCLSFILSACHGSKGMEEFNVPEEFDETRNYEITFWAKNDTNKAQTLIYENCIKSFEAIYPNIKINLRLYTDYNTIYNDVITNIATGTTPDVCITYPDHIATYMSGNNTVVPLDSLIADEKYGLGGNALKFDSVKKEEVVAKYLEECTLNGQCYALPYMRSTEACYINQTYVEALGYEVPEVLTWDYMFEVAEAALATGADGNYLINGQNVMIPIIYKSTDNMMIQYLKQNDFGYSDDKGNIDIFNDDTKDFLFEIAKHGKTKAFSTFKISSYPANFINAGQCIFAIDSTAGSTWMGGKAHLSDISEDKRIDFELAVRPIPQVDVNRPQMISQGPSVCVFNKKDNNQVLAAWIFAQFLLTNDTQNAYAMTEGYIPVTTKAQNSEEYLEYINSPGVDKDNYYVKIEASKLLLDNVDNTFVTPVFNGSVSLRNAAGQMIENVVKSVRRSEVVDEAYMEKLYKDVTALYRLDQKDIGSLVGQQDLGDLPPMSIGLLATLAVVWVILIGYFIYNFAKKKKH